MKRYRIEHRRPYADDPESVEEVAVEDPNGDWVPADKAERCFEAMTELLEAYGYIDFTSNEEYEADSAVIKARAVIAEMAEERRE